MQLYLIRHGQTEWNAEQRIQGSIDTPLNEYGRTQARELAFKLKGVPVHRIYTSPLARAHETAQILNQHFQVKLMTEEALKEASYGEAEGMTRQAYHEKYAERLADVRQLPVRERLQSKIIPDGESMAEVAARALTFLKDLSLEREEAHILIVCHGGLIRSVLMSLFEWEDRRVSIENTGYVVLTRQQGNFSLKESHGLFEMQHQQFIF